MLLLVILVSGSVLLGAYLASATIPISKKLLRVVQGALVGHYVISGFHPLWLPITLIMTYAGLKFGLFDEYKERK